MISKLRNNNVITNSTWLILGKIVQSIISFFVGILTTRFLGPNNYGVLNLAMAYVSFAVPLCTLGIHNIIVREFIDSPKKEGELIGSGIAIRILSSLVAIIMLVIIVNLLHPGDKVLIYTSAIYSFVLVFRPFDLFEYWYQSKLLSKISAGIGIVAYILTSIFRVAILFLGKSIYWFAFAYVLDLIIIMILHLLVNKKRGYIKLSYNLKTSWGLIKKSYHYILSVMMVVIYAQMDKVMIGRMMDTSAVGLYSTAVTICGLWTFVLQAIIDSARPAIIKLRKFDRPRYLDRIVQLYSVVIWVSICVSLVICIASPIIITILYGETYRGAIGPLRIVTWYTCFSYLGIARNIWSVCENKQKYEKSFALSGVVSNAVLNHCLISACGINGAAIASLITQIITNVLVPYCIKDTRENALCVLKAFNIKNLFSLFRDL